MSNFIKNIFENDTRVDFKKIVISLFGLIIIRTFLENFSSPYFNGFLFPPKEVYAHFATYYFSVFLSFALILYFFTKKSIYRILNFEIKIFLFILIPPIADLIVTNGNGSLMSYVLAGTEKFPYLFFKLMDPRGFAGITFGIHVAAYLIFGSMSVFIYKATHSYRKAFFGILASYSILFLYAISPSIIAAANHTNKIFDSASTAYAQALQDSWLFTTQENVTTPLMSFFQPSINIAIQHLFDTPITQLFFVAVLIQLAMLFAIFFPKLWQAFKKNIRTERILFWFAISFTGIYTANNIFKISNFSNSVNIITFTVFLSLIALNIWLAVCINDCQDIEIDRIANPDRPLVNGSFSLEQWRNLQLSLIALIILGISTINTSVTFFILLTQMSYYIYSDKPFRLKNNFLTSSILVGLAAIAISMSGFFLVSPYQHLNILPLKTFLILGLTIALISNFKDIKDYEGDKIANIHTMPVVFGQHNAKLIIATLFGIVFISLPILFKTPQMMFFGIITSLFMFFIMTKKQYREIHVFFLFFVYFLLFIIV